LGEDSQVAAIGAISPAIDREGERDVGIFCDECGIIL
jgi:hypothetical protein